MAVTKRKRIVVLVVLLLAAAGGAGYYFYYRGGQETLGDRLLLYGNIDIRQVDLAFNAHDRIVEMRVVEGQRVNRDQLLAVLDTRRLKIDVQRAQAELSKTKRDLEFAEIRLRDIVAARSRDPGAVSRIEEDKARAERNALAALVHTDEAKLALARKNYSDGFLYAPKKAVVQTRILEPGAMASPEKPVFTLALIDPIWARVFVDEPNLGRIREGMRAYVTTDSFPGKRYPGWVGFVSPVAEFTPKTVETERVRTDLVYQVRVYVCNPENELRLGMPVTVSVPFKQPAEPLTEATACPSK